MDCGHELKVEVLTSAIVAWMGVWSSRALLIGFA